MKGFELELKGKPYTIKLKSFGRVEINGTSYHIRSLPHRNIIFIPMEYDLPIPEGKVMLTCQRLADKDREEEQQKPSAGQYDHRQQETHSHGVGLRCGDL